MNEWVRVFLLVTGLLGCAVCNAEQSPGAASQVDNAARCGACHLGPLALDRWSADELAGRIAAIRDGATAHPPVDVDLANDAIVAELARALAAP
jgi:hypothetical protein